MPSFVVMVNCIHLLKPPLEPGTVLYEGELSQFAEDIKKWKERYVVVKNDFAVESYENREVRHASLLLARAVLLNVVWVDWHALFFETD